MDPEHLHCKAYSRVVSACCTCTVKPAHQQPNPQNHHSLSGSATTYGKQHHTGTNMRKLPAVQIRCPLRKLVVAVTSHPENKEHIYCTPTSNIQRPAQQLTTLLYPGSSTLWRHPCAPRHAFALYPVRAQTLRTAATTRPPTLKRLGNLVASRVFGPGPCSAEPMSNTAQACCR